MLKLVLACVLALNLAAGTLAAEPLTVEEVWKPPQISGV